MFIMKRYQNPEVFERLAMAYALGTLQGRARQRFQGLMDKHFYLRAVTEAYERQFAAMNDLLPAVKPPEHVWQTLSQELQLDTVVGQKRTARETTNVRDEDRAGSVWDWLRWPAMAFASVMASVLTVFMLQPQPAADAYASQLMSPDNELALTAQVAKDDMSIVVASVGAVPMPDNMMPTLWCMPKDGGKPMKMGTLKHLGNGKIDITDEIWAGLKDVREFAISMEPMDAKEAEMPKGQMMYRGLLKARADINL